MENINILLNDLEDLEKYILEIYVNQLLDKLIKKIYVFNKNLHSQLINCETEYFYDKYGIYINFHNKEYQYEIYVSHKGFEFDYYNNCDCVGEYLNHILKSDIDTFKILKTKLNILN